MQYYCGYLIDVKTDMFTELHIYCLTWMATAYYYIMCSQPIPPYNQARLNEKSYIALQVTYMVASLLIYGHIYHTLVK